MAEDTYSWHEAMDRVSILAETLGKHVAEHPVVESDAELSALAEKATDALYALYQAISLKAPHMRAAVETIMRGIDAAIAPPHPGREEKQQ